MYVRDWHRRAYGLFLRLPPVQARVRRDVDKAMHDLENKLVPSGPGVTKFTALPASGWTAEQVRAELDRVAQMEHTRWEDGKVSGAVYHGGEELCSLQTDAFAKFGVSNPIHPDVFPGVRKMEAEVVAMVLALFHAPSNAGGGSGVCTSGGTESILMACLSARNHAFERGIHEPEIIVPETAHPAFRKAAEYFNLKLHLVPCPPPHYKSDLTATASLINSRTALLVGSAPNFPHGIVDDVPALSRLAERSSTLLHVDCCLGSFIMPLLTTAGFPSPDFDFRLPGVTSISVDTHKYGFAPKGNSVLLYRSAQLRKYQYYVCADWSGGVYASPGAAGSRPGALIAGTWASMMRFGVDGYVRTCVKIVGARERIEEAIRRGRPALRSLRVIGKPVGSVIAFAAECEVADENLVDIYDVADGMGERGWHLNALQSPAAIHVAVTVPLAEAVEGLLDDLEAVVEECRGRQKREKGDVAALYGVAGAMPDKGVVRELAVGFLDTLYKV
ncbi:PLP-dependent transferase [Piedraia hortae CBS 480.64]|uniref:sphinganine-1-phosphate aldolase n=1 Tax=Piedraia hortae CBS 480.64 TaxID=1314780 RepID=A0A6A7C5R7_9PEZI|nr:PLP-dependent transferase [Piedraia hortae CBS 480.64]